MTRKSVIDWIKPPQAFWSLQKMMLPTSISLCCLEQRSVTKIYHALVEGDQDIDELELNKPIYSSASRSKVDFQKGKTLRDLGINH